MLIIKQNLPTPAYWNNGIKIEVLVVVIVVFMVYSSNDSMIVILRNEHVNNSSGNSTFVSVESPQSQQTDAFIFVHIRK